MQELFDEVKNHHISVNSIKSHGISLNCSIGVACGREASERDDSRTRTFVLVVLFSSWNHQTLFSHANDFSENRKFRKRIEKREKLINKQVEFDFVLGGRRREYFSGFHRKRLSKELKILQNNHSYPFEFRACLFY